MRINQTAKDTLVTCMGILPITLSRVTAHVAQVVVLHLCWYMHKEIKLKVYLSILLCSDLPFHTFLTDVHFHLL